ncbi:ubiquitin carboxyl-terminal hydrolase 26 [Pelomyxa schiedti]|nr:ubiquitin carboxyl-terminal hydrolase 26 [Pelomyxa schiedti]
MDGWASDRRRRLRDFLACADPVSQKEEGFDLVYHLSEPICKKSLPSSNHSWLSHLPLPRPSSGADRQRGNGDAATDSAVPHCRGNPNCFLGLIDPELEQLLSVRRLADLGSFTVPSADVTLLDSFRVPHGGISTPNFQQLRLEELMTKHVSKRVSLLCPMAIIKPTLRIKLVLPALKNTASSSQTDVIRPIAPSSALPNSAVLIPPTNIQLIGSPVSVSTAPTPPLPLSPLPVSINSQASECQQPVNSQQQRIFDFSVPFVGLSNLGATCYMNAVLQCISAEPSLSQILLAWNSETSEGADPAKLKICVELQKLVAEMHFSLKKHVSTSSLARSASIDTRIQQDPHEFYSLLCNLVEGVFSKSLILKERISSLLTGDMEYITRCTICNQSSRQKEPFFEIKLSIPKARSIKDCIQEYFSEETIPGDYRFDRCKCPNSGKVRRVPTITRFPEILNLQLVRFHFSALFGSEVKIMTEISYPQFLDTKTIFPHASTEGPHHIYQLFAVVSHIGGSAQGGHYIGYLRNRDRWWKCNDTSITECSCFPPDNSYYNETPYMLLYHLKATAPTTIPYSPAVSQIISENQQLWMQLSALPSLEVKEKQAVENCLDNLDSMLEGLAAPSNEDYRWISTSWLSSWLNGTSDLPPIDNKPILCEHNNVTMSKHAAPLRKRISVSMWAFLQGNYRGGPELSHEHCCVECLKEWVKNKGTSRTYKERKKSVLATLTKSRGWPVPPDGLYISKRLIGDWEKTSSSLNFSVRNLTSDLLCPHKKLVPNSKTLCLPVSQEIWEYFTEHSEGDSVVPLLIREGECPICILENKLLAEELIKERELIGSIVKNLSDLQTDRRYILLPGGWGATWRSYVMGQSQTRPGPIDSSGLLCPHKKVTLMIPKFIFWETKSINSNFTDSAPFQLVGSEAFRLLSLKYGCKESGIRFIIHEFNQKIPLYIQSFEPELIEYISEPEVCVQCAANYQKVKDIEQAQFFNKEVLVKRVSRRYIEKLYNRLTGYSSAYIMVSSFTTVSDLKLILFETMGIPPKSQVISFVDDKRVTHQLDCDTKTLGEYLVTPNSTIYVGGSRSEEEEEEEGFPSSPQNTPVPKKKQIAFEGTGLSDFALGSSKGSSTTSTTQDITVSTSSTSQEIAQPTPAQQEIVTTTTQIPPTPQSPGTNTQNRIDDSKASNTDSFPPHPTVTVPVPDTPVVLTTDYTTQTQTSAFMQLCPHCHRSLDVITTPNTTCSHCGGVLP